jgi:hypothetical protein
MDPTKEQSRILGVSREKCDRGTATDYTSVRENKAWALHKSKLTETGEEQSREHAHNFPWHQGNCSQILRPGRPNSQFRILLRRFKASAWKCTKTSPQTLATKELAVATWHRAISSFFFFHQGIFYIKNTSYFSLFPLLKLKLKGPHFDTALRWSRQNRGWCWPPSQNTTSRKHLKKWHKRWKRCIRTEGDYSEDDDGQ